ncbi:aldolase [Candidatus Woesebacteria bacterium]|nr:aldolase [Candidatus Woesebacteria bacterium]QQG47587.1 MAG: aldolase [Candidatus Woesebacteria bacterium]
MTRDIVNRILRNGRGMILAYDHGFEHGPVDFDEKSVDPGWVMEIADNGNFTAVACQKGIASYYYDPSRHRVPLILKLNGKTSFHKEEEPISLQNCDVDEAISLGAIGVGYTIYVGSEHEQTMIQEFSKVEREAHEKGLVVVGWMYPRGKHVPNDIDHDVLAYSARLALELNCDAVKIKYTGDVESFKWVVKSAGKAKVFVVGGPRTEMALQLVDTAQQIIEAGAVGFAIGRNMWQAKDPLEASKQIADIVFKT